MSEPLTGKCLAHPKFKELVRTRGQFSFYFTLIIVIGYGIYVLGMAYAPAFMSKVTFEGGTMTNGILIAILVILSGMFCAGFYTWWANRKFDVLKAELLKDLGHE